LKVWIRMGRIGRIPTVLVGGEVMALDILDLTEFKTPVLGTPRENLILHTPVPQNSNLYVHGNVSTDQVIGIDPNASMIKFNGWPLKVESERIVSNQTEAFYVSLQTGFAKLFRDATVLIDRSVTYAASSFPSWMDVDAAQDVTIE